MSNLFSFISGLVIGIYIDQCYKLPKVSSYIKYISETLKKNEK